MDTRVSLISLAFSQRKCLGLRTVGDDAQKRGASDNPLDSAFPLGALRGGVAGVCSGRTVLVHPHMVMPGAVCGAARVKKLMKIGKGCKHVSKDAIALTAVATVRCSRTLRVSVCHPKAGEKAQLGVVKLSARMPSAGWGGGGLTPSAEGVGVAVNVLA